MNILILKDRHEFALSYGWRLFHAHFAGHWQEDGSFLIRKDRLNGKVGVAISGDELAEYINSAQENM